MTADKPQLDFEYGHWEEWSEEDWRWIPEEEMADWAEVRVRFYRGMFWEPRRILPEDGGDDYKLWRPVSPEELWRREQYSYEACMSIIYDHEAAEAKKKADPGGSG